MNVSVTKMQVSQTHIHETARSFLRRLENRSGQALVEFTFIALLLIVLFFGLIDYSRAILVRQVLVNISREGANLASRGTPLLDALNGVAGSAHPLDIDQDGYIILTEVFRDDNGELRILSQVPRGGKVQPSMVGQTNQASQVNMPTGIPPLGHSVVVAEAFYSFSAVTPIGKLLSGAAPTVIYEAAYF